MAEGTHSTTDGSQLEAQTIRVRRVVTTVESLRELHEELRSAINWSRLQQVLARERVPVVRLAMRRRANVFCSLGVSVISLNSNVPKARWTKLVAHEYGHIKLHLTDHFEGHEVVRNLSPCQKSDPREFEAELFALMLMRGPGLQLHHPDFLRIVRRIESARAQQIALPLPDSGRAPRDPRDHLSYLLDRSRKLAHGKTSWGSTGDPPPISDDTERVEYQPGRIVYTDPDGRRWAVYDVVHFGRHPQGQRKHLVPTGSEYAKTRYFVNTIGERRRYVFATRELRDVAVKHFDRQLREAKPIKTISPLPEQDRATKTRG